MQSEKVKVMVILCIISIISMTISYSISNKKSISFNTVELSKLTEKEWLEEYKYIWDYLDDNSLILDTLESNGYELESLYKTYEKKICECEDNAEYYICLKDFFGEFNGFAHLSILDYNFFKYTEQVYTNINSMAWSNILTDERVKDNYEIWNNIIRDAESREKETSPRQTHYLPRDNMTDNETDMQKTNSQYEDNIQEILQQYDVILSDVEQNCIKPSDVQDYNYRGISINASPSGNVVEIDIEKDSTAYIKIKSFGREYIESDNLMLCEIYNKISEYSDLVIDITENTGGSSYYWYKDIVMPNLKKDLVYTDYILYNITDQNKSFILETIYETDELLSIDELDDNIETSSIPDNVLHNANYFVKSTNIFEKQKQEIFEGKIWVRIGGKVYSASDTFSAFCKKTGFATLVGEETGGNGMGGDPAIFALPYSKLVVRYDMSYGLNLDGTDNLTHGTKPDIEID